MKTSTFLRGLVVVGACAGALGFTTAPLGLNSQCDLQNIHSKLHATRSQVGKPLYATVPEEAAVETVDNEVQIAKIKEQKSSAMQEKLKVGGYFGLWYALNIGYNIYNKQVLNVLPLPWTVGTAQLAAGLLYILPVWASGLRKAPKVSLENIKNLSPIAAMHTAAHITAVLSLGAGAVSFTHIVKAGEPLFTSAAGAIIMKEIFPWQVYATLMPVIVGVGLASLKELSFSWVAFGNAMGSNLASALRGTFSKGAMGKPQGENMNATNLYAVLTFLAIGMLLPFAAVIEGPRLASTWAAATAAMSAKELALKLLASGLFYYTYNEVAYLALDSVNPVTHAVGNTIKRVVVILASVLFFGTKMTPLGTFGSALAIGGVLLYSLAKNKFKN